MKNASLGIIFTCSVLLSCVALFSCASPEVIIPKCALKIVHSYPSDQDTGIAVDSSVLIVFSAEVSQDVIEKKILVDRALAGGWVAENVTYTFENKDTGFWVTIISQKGAWDPATTYRVTVDATGGISSKDGRCVLNSGLVFAFTTS